MLETERDIARTSRISFVLEELISNSKTIYISTRNYVITGDSIDLADMEITFAQIEKEVGQLKSLMKDSLAIADLNQLMALIVRKQTFSKMWIKHRSEHGFDEARKLFMANTKHAVLSKNIIELIYKLEEREETLLRERVAISDQQSNRTIWVIITGTALSITMILMALYFIRRASEEKRIINKSLIFANKELESFTYSVAHDLRAPLRAMQGNAQILSEDYAENLDQEAKKTIGVITRNAKKMGELIDHLLAFSRLGRKELVKSNVNMNALAKEVINELYNPDSDKKVIIDFHPLPPASGDYTLLKQVWINLISNALKFSSTKPEAKIEIGSVKNGNEITYYVKDNGAGFDMQYYDKLFGVFQRLHSQDEFEGTGIGLANVQRILNRHGGKIWAEAKINNGACFLFNLQAIK